MDDFHQRSERFGAVDAEGERLGGDIDGDGDVGFQDFLLLSADFGKEKPCVGENALETIEPTRLDLALAEI